MNDEKIEAAARAIDPDAWKLAEAPQYAHLPKEAAESLTRSSLEQARAAWAAFQEVAEYADNWRHQDCSADTGTSWVPEGRQYVIRCEWCPEVFYGPTKAFALAKFRVHEREKLDGPNRAGGGA